MKRATMMQSGTYVTPTEGVPTLTDISRGLSRIPRFGGHTTQPWTVLDHSLFCHDMALAEQQPAAVRLALLLHDAHEVLTGDIPTWFKTSDIRTLQHELDRRIMDAHFPWKAICYEDEKSTVSVFDRRALWAEGRTLGPNALQEMELAEFVEVMGGKPNVGDVALLQHGLLTGKYGEYRGNYHKIVRYELLVLQLQREVRLDGVALAH